MGDRSPDTGYESSSELDGYTGGESEVERGDLADEGSNHKYVENSRGRLIRATAGTVQRH